MPVSLLRSTVNGTSCSFSRMSYHQSGISQVVVHEPLALVGEGVADTIHRAAAKVADMLASRAAVVVVFPVAFVVAWLFAD